MHSRAAYVSLLLASCNAGVAFASEYGEPIEPAPTPAVNGDDSVPNIPLGTGGGVPLGTGGAPAYSLADLTALPSVAVPTGGPDLTGGVAPPVPTGPAGPAGPAGPEPPKGHGRTTIDLCIAFKAAGIAYSCADKPLGGVKTHARGGNIPVPTGAVPHTPGYGPNTPGHGPKPVKRHNGQNQQNDHPQYNQANAYGGGPQNQGHGPVVKGNGPGNGPGNGQGHGEGHGQTGILCWQMVPGYIDEQGPHAPE
jgi:hypothetical protein